MAVAVVVVVVVDVDVEVGDTYSSGLIVTANGSKPHSPSSLSLSKSIRPRRCWCFPPPEQNIELFRLLADDKRCCCCCCCCLRVEGVRLRPRFIVRPPGVDNPTISFVVRCVRRLILLPLQLFSTPVSVFPSSSSSSSKLL